jgi:sigma-54 specific flagellar transcriptional regulator A
MVLILDNNNNRANGLSAALNFVGQPAQMVSESDFQKEMSKTKDAIVVIGALAELDHEQVIKASPATPFFGNRRNAKTSFRSR